MTTPIERTIFIESDGTINPLYPSDDLFPSDTLYPGGVGAPSKRTTSILSEDRITMIDPEDREVIIA